MSEIEFSKPHLQRVKRVQKYELDGVAFVKGYEKPVRLTFECRGTNNFSLEMEALYQAKEVSKFISKLLKNCAKDLGMRDSFPALYAEWEIEEGLMKEALDRIEKAIGNDWKEA